MLLHEPDGTGPALGAGLSKVRPEGVTLGVVGLGRIGQEVAARARSFGMTIVAHDPYISEEVAASMDITLLPLDDLCGRIAVARTTAVLGEEAALALRVAYGEQRVEVGSL